MSGDAERATVEALYAASGAGDWALVETMLSDDLCIVEAEGLPYAGVYRGRGALQQLFNIVVGCWNDLALDIHAITASEGHAVCLLTMHATVKHSGDRLALPIAEAFRFKGGKVAEITPYYFDVARLMRVSAD